jgi:cell shape-determining protein MreD
VRLIVLFSLAGFVALAIQTSLPRWLPAWLLVPDLVLALAVNLGLKHHGVLAAAVAFALGYAMDAFSGLHIGLNAFVVTLLFLLAYELSQHVVAGGAWVGAALVFAGVVFRALGVNLDVVPTRTAVCQVLLQAVLSAALTPAVFRLLTAGKRILGLPDRVLRE